MAGKGLKKTKPVYDNVYGFIFLTKSEYDLINSLYFHRLRWLNQLGMASYAFPGAVHNRFSHSLGVLYIVDKIIENLRRERPDLIKPGQEEVLRLTALLHDIGHYPLSHTIEQAYKWDVALDKRRSEKRKAVLDISKESQADIPDYLGYPKDLPEFFSHGLTQKEEDERSPAHHEQFAQAIIRTDGFKKVLEECRFNLSTTRKFVESVSYAIEGAWDINPLAPTVINALVDADSLDYMTRDAYFTGVKLGVYDLDNILRKTTLVKGPKPGEESKVEYISKGYECLGFELDSMQSIENFILTKYHWYTQIIYNYRVLVYDEIAKYFYFHLLRRKNNSVLSFKQLNKNARDGRKLLTFDDNYFWSVVKRTCAEDKNKIMQKMARALLERRNPKYIPFPNWGAKGFKKRGLLKNLKNDRCIAKKEEVGDFKDEFLRSIKPLGAKDIFGFVKSREILKPFGEKDVARKTVRMGKNSQWQDIYEVSDQLKKHQGDNLIRFAVYDFTRVLED